MWRRATGIGSREKLYLQRDSKRDLLFNLGKTKFRMGIIAQSRYIRYINSSEKRSYLSQRTALEKKKIKKYKIVN